MKLKVKDYRANEVLRFLRENLDLTQKELADEVNKARSSVEKYDEGLVSFPYKVLYTMALKHNLTITIKSNDGKFNINATEYKPNELFKLLRTSFNYSQRGLAIKTKIGKSSIEKYERNIVNYSFETLLKVLKACDLEMIISE